MAVRIRMKMMGRRHRPFFRICAIDARRPRDGRTLEELGTYDPLVPEVDARAVLNGERISYWLGVGALPSEKCKVLIKKYGENGTHLQQQKAALDRLAQQRTRPEPPMVSGSPAAETATSEETAAPEQTAEETPPTESDSSAE